MELNKSSITSLIIAACAGLVLGAGATYYYYARAGGEMDKRLAAATAGINAAREQQQREIAELQGLVIALQSMSEIVSKLQNKLEIAEQNSKNLTESLTGKTQQLTSLISEKQQTEKLLEEANKLLTAYSESCKKKLAIIKRQRNAAYVVAAAALTYSLIKK